MILKLARLLFLVLLIRPLAAEELFTALSTHSTRILGMGGCYAANSEWTDAAVYNPAGGHPFAYNNLRLNYRAGLNRNLPQRPPDQFRLVILTNPTPLFRWQQIDRTPGDTWLEKVYPVSLLLSSLHVSYGPLALSLVPAEQLLSFPTLVKDLQVRSTLWYSSFSWRIDDRVSVGLSLPVLPLVNGDKRSKGMIYGIMLYPGKSMKVGIMAIDLPAGAGSVRQPLERIHDNTLNIGLTWDWPLHRFSGINYLRLAVDSRNVSNEGTGYNSQEMHFGVELSLGKHLFLRSGAYWPNNVIVRDNRSAAVRTFGLGLVDANRFRRYSRRLVYPLPVLEYACVIDPSRDPYHLLTLRIGY